MPTGSDKNGNNIIYLIVLQYLEAHAHHQETDDNLLLLNVGYVEQCKYDVRNNHACVIRRLVLQELLDRVVHMSNCTYYVLL